MQPTKPSLALTFIPKKLRVALAAVHEHPNFAAACQAVRLHNDDCCIFSDLPAVRVMPRWLFLPQTKTVRLAGLYPVCEQVAALLAVEDGGALEQEEELFLHRVLAAANKYACCVGW